MKTVRLKDGWVKKLSFKGWESYFHWPKKFNDGDEVLVSYSHKHDDLPENTIHVVVGTAHVSNNKDYKELVYEVRRPDGEIRYVSSTYLIKPKELKRIISKYWGEGLK